MTKVSVIIPVYNAEKYLSECLDSVVNQTLKDFEIICINDGSCDGSLNILNEYSRKYSEIIVIDKKNEGVGKTRNLGIKSAEGEFVAFIDPDDVYPANDVLEVLYNEAINNNVLICGGEFSHFSDENKDFSQYFDQSDSGYIFPESGTFDYKDYQFDYGYHRFIYNRLFLLRNNIFYSNYKRFQDPPFFAKAMIKAGKFYGVHKNTYGYRFGHQNIIWTPDKVLDLLRGINDNFKIAKKYNCETLSDYTYIRLQQHFKLIDENNINLKALLLLNSMPKYNPDVNTFLEEHKLRLLQDKFMNYIRERFFVFINYIREKFFAFVKYTRKKFFEFINFIKENFFVKNTGCHKIFCLFGIKLKFRTKKLVQREQINSLEQRLNNIEMEISALKEKTHA